MKKLLACLLVVVMMMATLVGCGGGAQKPAEEPSGDKAPVTAPEDTAAGEETVIQIGVYGCISGADAESGREDVNGVTAAVNWINDHGGIKWGDGTAKFEIVKIDGTSDTSQAAMAMERAITNNDLKAIIGGSSSSFTVAAMPIVDQYKIPYFAGTSANLEVSQKGYSTFFQFFAKGFRYSEVQIEFLQILADYLEMDLADVKVGILYMNNAWGTDTSAESATLCADAGIEVAVNESYPATGLTDATTLITKLRDAGCNVVFPASQAQDTKLILQTMKSMNYDPLVIGSGSGFVFPTFYEDMGDAANGVFSSCSWNWNSSNVQENDFFFNEFLPWYEENFNEFAPEQTGPCSIYMFILADILEEIQTTDSTAICDAMRALNADNCEWLRLIAPGDDADIEDNGSNMNALACMVQWQDGKPRTVYPEVIAANPILDPETLEPFAVQFDKFK